MAFNSLPVQLGAIPMRPASILGLILVAAVVGLGFVLNHRQLPGPASRPGRRQEQHANSARCRQDRKAASRVFGVESPDLDRRVRQGWQEGSEMGQVGP